MKSYQNPKSRLERLQMRAWFVVKIDDTADGAVIGGSGANVNLWPQLSMRF